MRIIFVGTSEFSVPILEKLNEHHEIPLVVTQVDRKKGRGKKLKATPVKEKAMELKLDVYQPENINEEESINYLKSFDADLLVVVSYGQILKKKVLDIPKLFPINIHASILPKLRGAAPINRAIINGESESGVTIMKMEEGLDTGDISLIRRTRIENKNSKELLEELSLMGADLVIDFIDKLNKEEINFIKQNENEASYASKIIKEDFEIDFSKKSFDIVRLIKGLSDKGFATTTYKGLKFKIVDAEILEKENKEYEFGKVVSSNKELIVATGDKFISVSKIQFPNKKAMDIKSFLLGNEIEENEILGG